MIIRGEISTGGGEEGGRISKWQTSNENTFRSRAKAIIVFHTFDDVNTISGKVKIDQDLVVWGVYFQLKKGDLGDTVLPVILYSWAEPAKVKVERDTFWKWKLKKDTFRRK